MNICLRFRIKNIVPRSSISCFYRCLFTFQSQNCITITSINYLSRHRVPVGRLFLPVYSSVVGIGDHVPGLNLFTSRFFHLLRKASLFYLTPYFVMFLKQSSFFLLNSKSKNLLMLLDLGWLDGSSWLRNCRTENSRRRRYVLNQNFIFIYTS